jgi:hypothetical protein
VVIDGSSVCAVDVVDAVVGALKDRPGLPLAPSTFVMVPLMLAGLGATLGGMVGTTEPIEEAGYWCAIVFSRGLDEGITVVGEKVGCFLISFVVME